MKLARHRIEPHDSLHEFANRLKTSLLNAGFDNDPAAIAYRINHVSGSASVTYHAVRKWLNGQSMPTQPRMRALAALAGVSAEWLRYGQPPGVPASDDNVSQCPPQLRAAAFDIATLNETDRMVVGELLEILYEAQTRTAAPAQKLALSR